MSNVIEAEYEVVTAAEHNAAFDPARAGGMNDNEIKELPGLYKQIMELNRTDYAAPANMTEVQAEQGYFSLSGGGSKFAATDYAIAQMCDRLSPGLAKFTQHMQGQHRDWMSGVLTETLQKQPAEKKFQVRTITPDGQQIARSVVSDAYKPIDDSLLLPPVIELLGDGRKKWRSLGGQLTDQKSFLRFISREPAVKNIGPNHRDWFVGFQYSNSEVGAGLCRFDLFLYDSFCENGCIFGQKSIVDVSFRHIGPRIKTGFGLISEERVQAAEQASILGLITDATQQVLASDFDTKIKQHLEAAQARKLPADRATAMKEIGRYAGLTKAQQEAVMLNWHSNEDNVFGVANAITKTAQDCETFSQRASLEEAGGKVMEMQDRQWKSILALAS